MASVERDRDCDAACAACGKPATAVCGGFAYCGRECSDGDWEARHAIGHRTFARAAAAALQDRVRDRAADSNAVRSDAAATTSTFSPDLVSRNVVVLVAYLMAKRTFGSSGQLRQVIAVVVLWLANEIATDIVDAFATKSKNNVQRAAALLGSVSRGRPPEPGERGARRSAVERETFVADAMLVSESKAWRNMLDDFVHLFAVSRIYLMTNLAYMMTDVLLANLFTGMPEVLQIVYGFALVMCLLWIIDFVRNAIAETIRQLATSTKTCD